MIHTPLVPLRCQGQLSVAGAGAGRRVSLVSQESQVLVPVLSPASLADAIPTSLLPVLAPNHTKCKMPLVVCDIGAVLETKMSLKLLD
jgi:hypothetical protein